MYVTGSVVFLQALINSKPLVFAVSAPLHIGLSELDCLGLLCLEHANIVDEQ